MNTTPLRAKLIAVAMSVTVTFGLLNAVCAIANHDIDTQVAAAKAAHPQVVASVR